MIVLATDNLDEVRRFAAHLRRAMVAKRHPDGGVVVQAKTATAQLLLRELEQRFGTRRWGRRGWVNARPQLWLPGVRRA
jgi:hypothetical protein